MGKFSDFDNEYMENYTGFRDDILIESWKGRFYRIGFMDLSNATPCPFGLENKYIDVSHDFIIVDKLNIKKIFEILKKLEASNFFERIHSISISNVIIKTDWTKVNFFNDDVNQFVSEHN